MSIAITKRPITTFSGQQSRWNAGYNPIVYTFHCINTYDPVKYNILIEIYEFGSDKLLGVQKVKPFLNGTEGDVMVDFSSIINPYLQKIFSFTSTSINQKDQNSTLRFYLKYYEREYANVVSINSDQSNSVYIVPSANQLGYTYAGNLAEYVPYGSDVTPKARFLSKFKEPKYYVGYPFYISFIYSDNISGSEILKHEDEMDINKTIVFNSDTDLDTSQVRSINNLKLKDSYDANTKYVGVYLKTGAPSTDTYVDAGYVDIGYTL